MPRRQSDEYEPVRPSRSTRKAQVSYADADDDEEEYDDRIQNDDDDEDDGEGDYQDQGQHQPKFEQVIHKPSRNRRAPARYAEEFEDKLLHTSPVKSDPVPRRNGRSSRSHPDMDMNEDEEEEEEVMATNTASRRKSFPPRPIAVAPESLQGMFDDDDNGPPPPPDTQETATDATPRKATRGKSRQSSEGSFEPDQSDVATQTGQSESDDPIANDFIHDDTENDDLESDYGRPRRQQRQVQRRPKPRQSKRSTRSSARTRNRRDEEEEDDDGIPFKKRLRERKSAVNYALPPADLSAEILQDAIATASRPGGSGSGRPGVGRAGGVRFSGAAGKALPWSARGRDLAQAMGDPDTSDSVRDLFLSNPHVQSS